MARRPTRVNVGWETPLDKFAWEHVAIEVLMDVREQLERIVAVLQCPETREIPRTLRAIRRAMPTSRKAKSR